MIWKQDLKMLLSYTLFDDKGNNDYFIRHDLKPLYLCHDNKDSYDWFDLRVYDILQIYDRGKQNYLVLSLEDPKVNILVFR
jgi:hypothetical protein